MKRHKEEILKLDEYTSAIPYNNINNIIITLIIKPMTYLNNLYVY